MGEWHLSTPVALFIFNRPDLTARVVSEITKLRPPILLVVADGPRSGRNEFDLCAQARAVATGMDWNGQLLTNFSDTNLGCGRRISSGLNWVFDQVEEAIVLEDDCLPHQGFFRFCQEMLVRYRDCPRVMHVCGSNYLPTAAASSASDSDASYYFSKYAYIWGWASWRRAWKLYDPTMRRWGEPASWNHHFNDATPTEKRYWQTAWRAVAGGRYDTWDVQWVLSCIARDGLAVVPCTNLISNIGFGRRATHTQLDALADLPVEAVGFPLRHPTVIERDAQADAQTIAQLAKASLRPRWQRLLQRAIERAAQFGRG